MWGEHERENKGGHICLEQLTFHQEGSVHHTICEVSHFPQFLIIQWIKQNDHMKISVSSMWYNHPAKPNALAQIEFFSSIAASPMFWRVTNLQWKSQSTQVNGQETQAACHTALFKKHSRKAQKLYRMIHTDGLEQWRRKEANEKPSMLTYGLVGWLDHKTKMRMKCLCNIHRGYGKSWSMRKWATYAGRGDASRWVFDEEIHSASLDRGTHTSCTPPSSLLHLSL